MAESVAKYQQYEEYKDSGVEWLGEVPNEWSVVKLSYKMKLASGDTLTANDIEPIGQYAVYGGNGLRGYTKNYNCDGSYILIGRQGALCGNINLAKGKFFATEHAVVVYPYEEFNITFLSGFLEFMDLGQYSVSAAQPGLSVDRINALHILVPPISEQIIIGEFLDHETAQIDTLIEKQQTLIQLLKEKRQAVISHAVTKGLNPDAPMKDSGFEWLGDVPEHWEVCALKHILATPITDGPHETPVFLDEGVPFISAEAVSQGYINFDKKRAHISKLDNEKYSKKYTPKKYDIYIVKSGATTGVSAIVETDREFNIWSPLAVIRCAPYCEPYFTLFAIRSKYFQEEIRLNWNYGTQQNIGMAVLGNLLITYPPRKEAQEISNYLKRVTEKMNELIERAEQAIQLMQERRTALISAAVTGKIDVRGWEKN